MSKSVHVHVVHDLELLCSSLSIFTLRSSRDAALCRLFNCVGKPIKVSSNNIIPSAKSIVNTSMNSG